MLTILAVVAALHTPTGNPPVTLYRELVSAPLPFNTAPLALRSPALDRPSPFTIYRNERE